MHLQNKMPGDKLKIYNDIENFNAKNPIVSVGIFDGVHIGHKKIIARLNELAIRYKGESVLVTLWPHPKEVLKPENNNSLLLTTREEKESLLEKSGIDKDSIEEAINSLMDKGLIFEPILGIIKTT